MKLNLIRFVAIVMVAVSFSSTEKVMAKNTIVPSAKNMMQQEKGQYTLSYQPQPETTERLEWFKEAKFGMFIHWGLYSNRGGIAPDGKPQKHGYTEWYQKANRLSHAEYSKLAEEFNPVKFNAEEWVQIARNAGMKYITITTKHHDGFCLFDSAYTDYDVVDATPFKRDVLMELREACDKHGLKLCYYYSHCQDWEQYHAWNTSLWIYPEHKEGPVDHEKYLSGKALPQVAELCNRYRPDGFWFDTPWFNKQKLDRPVSKRFSDLVRALRPDCLINSRVVHVSGPKPLHADLFDYLSLGDQGIPTNKLPLYAESPDSIHHSYGYDKRPNVKYRSAKILIERMIRTVAGNGNYLLNIGPTGEGEIPPQAQAELAKIGKWLKVNGEAIYGTQANPFGKVYGWGEITAKDNKLYLFPIRVNGDTIELASLETKVVKAFVLDGGQKVKVETNEDKVRITLPKNDTELPQVVILECENKQ